MPVRPLMRSVSIAATALLVGVGLAVVTAAPANAATVSDTATLNAAILANDPVLEITSDFTLTANIAPISYAVQIIGNGHTIDAATFDAFRLDASATVDSLAIDNALHDALAIYLVSGETAVITDFSSHGASNDGIDATVLDDAVLQVTGGEHVDASYGIYLRAGDSSSVTIADVSVTDVSYPIFAEAHEDGSVVITGVRVTAGPLHNGGGNGYGVALWATETSSVTLDDLTVTSAADVADGAFSTGINDYQTDTSQVRLSNATLTRSSFGIQSYLFDASSAEISNIRVADNGAGILAGVNGAQASFTIRDSSVTDSADYGIDLELEGTGLVDSTTVSGSGGTGISILKSGGTPLSIVNSTISGNVNGGIAGSLNDNGTTLAIAGTTVVDNENVGISLTSFSASAVTVDNSTISGNSAGGLWNDLRDTSSAIVTNSTVSGNFAGAEGWGLWAGGEPTASYELRNSTITGNQGVVGAGFEDVSAFITHSIIAGNDIAGSYGEFWVSPGTTDSSVEWSLIGELVDDTAGAGFTQGPGVTSGVTDPGLEPLGDNGGPTLTHLLSASSLARDSGNPAITDAPALDQRGEARIVGSAIDIGAVEMAATLAPTGFSPGPAAVLAALLLLAGSLLVAARALRRRLV
ncbi:MAG: right-handed parallel beta-helix repeat-containing protein [Pseudolysinimonas sp.]|uniref:right-handed parallel beta-helix repeat-containing protein n=1 Tax=Pseudolysinimonas sp. TaxID=2680009 RepID=UPI0032665E7D